jgi:hypothetical protein
MLVKCLRKCVNEIFLILSLKIFIFPRVCSLLYYHPTYVHALLHCIPCTPQKLGFFQCFL